MNNRGMMKYFLVLFGVTLVGIVIASLWNSVPSIKNTAHAILDPSLGTLLGFNATLGMIIISAILALILTIVQKYTTNQALLRELKAEQKMLQQEMKKFEKDPEKLLELNKKQLEIVPKTMELTMRPVLFTSIPIILLIRWFNDYFAVNTFKFLGFMSWIWTYILLSIVFSIIFRKIFKVV